MTLLVRLIISLLNMKYFFYICLLAADQSTLMPIGLTLMAGIILMCLIIIYLQCSIMKKQNINGNEKRLNVTHNYFGNGTDILVSDVPARDTCNNRRSCPPERVHPYEYLQNTSQQESHRRRNDSTAPDHPQTVQAQTTDRLTGGEPPVSRASDYITLGYTPVFSYTGSMNQSNRISRGSNA